mgnify:CR=1 FL=1
MTGVTAPHAAVVLAMPAQSNSLHGPEYLCVLPSVVYARVAKTLILLKF